jgi:hypothetical protein
LRENLAYLQGTPCPNCGHVRAASEPGPRWHCPNCHNEYPRLLPLPLLEPSYAAVADPALIMLLAANLGTIGATFWFDFELKELMLIYWLQSVTIGVSFFIRMLASKAEGSGFEGPAARVFTAFFFLVHYGFFHLIYLVFMRPAAVPAIASMVGLCALGFVATHAYSLWHNIRRDRMAGVGAMTLLWLPYARIVPMHATIILGPQLAGGEYALLMFLGLKTFADLVMHVVEHRVLHRA